jgi:hypothetical protein
MVVSAKAQEIKQICIRVSRRKKIKDFQQMKSELIVSLNWKYLFQINFEFGGFFYLMKHDRAVVLPDIRNI